MISAPDIDKIRLMDDGCYWIWINGEWRMCAYEGDERFVDFHIWNGLWMEHYVVDMQEPGFDFLEGTLINYERIKEPK